MSRHLGYISTFLLWIFFGHASKLRTSGVLVISFKEDIYVRRWRRGATLWDLAFDTHDGYTGLAIGQLASENTAPQLWEVGIVLYVMGSFCIEMSGQIEHTLRRTTITT